MLACGTGTAQDETEAAVWFRRAAAQGRPLALYNLGHAYRRGAGVPQDDVQACACYMAALSILGPDEAPEEMVEICDRAAARLSADERAEAERLAAARLSKPPVASS
ncbi:MAG: sel1 repeat family protein [Rhodospirillaceae bacterium]|nr:sel1 repeat family protein [Rhodospirillaceae bacterium]